VKNEPQLCKISRMEEVHDRCGSELISTDKSANMGIRQSTTFAYGEELSSVEVYNEDGKIAGISCISDSVLSFSDDDRSSDSLPPGKYDGTNGQYLRDRENEGDDIAIDTSDAPYKMLSCCDDDERLRLFSPAETLLRADESMDDLQYSIHAISSHSLDNIENNEHDRADAAVLVLLSIHKMFARVQTYKTLRAFYQWKVITRSKLYFDTGRLLLANMSYSNTPRGFYEGGESLWRLHRTYYCYSPSSSYK
jgi:hypothetical protein